VLRTALKPQWLGLFAVLVVVVGACVQLGLWQLQIAQDQGLADTLRKAREARPAVIDSVVRPYEPFPNEQSNRAVTATGRYAASDQLLVGPRRLDGRTGWWVVTPLVVSETGARLAVVRGFVEESRVAGSGASVPPAAGGDVTVEGTLAPSESPAVAPADAPAGADEVMGAIDLSVMVNRWPGDLYNAFVFAQAERGPSGAGVPVAAGLERVPPPELTGGLKWRNAAYALQWWVFGGFAVFMVWRMVRDDAQRERADD
jgi:cytochrome oxidase assembly protein ShyY1